MRYSVTTILPLLALIPATAMSQDAFTFGGFSFDETNTPDQTTSLPVGTIDGAVFTAVPTTATSSVDFPDTPTTGFDPSRAMGFFLNNSAGPRAVNLPAGNNGATSRSGVLLSYSDNSKIANIPGDDFVVFESASTSTAPEALMIQVFDSVTMTWSPWYYEPADSFALYTGSANAGAMAIAIDLDDLGFTAVAEISQLRIANMTDEDRMQPGGASGGFVIPEDNGSTPGSELPAPPAFAGFAQYGSSTLDPDPLYVAVLSMTVPVELQEFSID